MYTHTMENYSAIKKRMNLAISDNIDGSGGYYAQWNMSDGEEQIPNNFTSMWDITNEQTNIQAKCQNRCINTENKLAVASGKESGEKG